MDTIFSNSKNSKTFDPQKLILLRLKNLVCVTQNLV